RLGAERLAVAQPAPRGAAQEPGERQRRALGPDESPQHPRRSPRDPGTAPQQQNLREQAEPAVGEEVGRPPAGEEPAPLAPPGAGWGGPEPAGERVPDIRRRGAERGPLVLDVVVEGTIDVGDGAGGERDEPHPLIVVLGAGGRGERQREIEELPPEQRGGAG